MGKFDFEGVCEPLAQAAVFSQFPSSSNHQGFFNLAKLKIYPPRLCKFHALCGGRLASWGSLQLFLSVCVLVFSVLVWYVSVFGMCLVCDVCVILRLYAVCDCDTTGCGTAPDLRAESKHSELCAKVSSQTLLLFLITGCFLWQIGGRVINLRLEAASDVQECLATLRSLTSRRTPEAQRRAMPLRPGKGSRHCYVSLLAFLFLFFLLAFLFLFFLLAFLFLFFLLACSLAGFSFLVLLAGFSEDLEAPCATHSADAMQLEPHGSASAGTSSFAIQAHCFGSAIEHLRKVQLHVLPERVQRLVGLRWSNAFTNLDMY